MNYDILSLKKNHIFVSRAATAIWLIVRAQKPGCRVLVPANLCYAAIYPIIYAGGVPVFCDVDGTTGNVTLALVKNHIEEIDMALLPHMYGNPISEMEEIVESFREQGILIIEDCASAMGASVNGKMCGSWGDYTLFSMGYSKTMDVGGGGILLSDLSLDEMERTYHSLPHVREEDHVSDEFFSKAYRLIRNYDYPEVSKAVWFGLHDAMRGAFVHLDDSYTEKMQEVLPQLEAIVEKRREVAAYYANALSVKASAYVYSFAEGACPWRFGMLIPIDWKQELVEFLLEQKVPVSDWYPAVTPIFGVQSELYPEAYAMGRRIINFPLLIEKSEIERICGLVNRFFDEKI